MVSLQETHKEVEKTDAKYHHSAVEMIPKKCQNQSKIQNTPKPSKPFPFLLPTL